MEQQNRAVPPSPKKLIRKFRGYSEGAFKDWGTIQENLGYWEITAVSWLGQIPRVQYFYPLDFTSRGNRKRRFP